MRRLIVLLTFITTSLVLKSQVLDSSNLPIIIFDTKGQVIKDSPRIQCDMKIIFNPADSFQKVSDTNYHYYGKISIEYRGSSSQMFPKKGISMETQNPDSTSRDAALLGMPADNDWVLLAAYDDNTLVRDVMSYQLSNEIGLYAPRCRFCELIINGSYQGLFILIEKIKQGKNRVNVEELTTLDISGDSLTGGYIYKYDKATGDDTQGWFSKYGTNYWTMYQYHYPRFDKMMTQQKTYIRNYHMAFEDLMNSSNYADTIKGYSKYIDTVSFIKYMLMCEISKNIDEYRISTYFNKHKDSKGGKIHAGPIWDYGLTYGLPDYMNGWQPSGWEIDYYDNPFFWSKLFKEPRFHNKLVNRWRNLRQTTFAEDHINQLIDSLTYVIDSARVRNFQKWPVLGIYTWPNYYINPDYNNHITYLKTWIHDRLIWMDKNLNYLPIPEPKPQPKPDTTGLALNDNIVSCYPNPFTDHLQIELGNTPATIRISDISGKEILIWETRDAQVFWDSRDLSGNIVPEGVYVLQITTGTSLWITKILKQN